MLDTQPNCVDSFSIATDPFAPPFFDFLLGFSSASTCRNRHLSPCAHRIQTCASGTREDAQIYMTGYYNFFISTKNLTYYVRAFISVAFFHRQSLPSKFGAGEDARHFRL